MAGRSKPPPGVEPEAIALFINLLFALGDQDERGTPVPCRRDPDLWTSDDRDDRELAAYACQPCPLIQICGEYAEAQDERHGVWGGRDRETEHKSHKKQRRAS